MIVNIGGKSYNIRIGGENICTVYTGSPMLSGIKLLASDNFVLQDSNGLYLTVKEGD